MTHALLSFSNRSAWAFGAAVWLTACGPDLTANEAARCDEQLSCDVGEVCYRGFCLPETTTYEPIDFADGGVADGSISSPLESVDAGGAGDAGLTDASSPVADAAVQDASAPQPGAPKDAGPPAPADAGASPPRDAGMPPRDAGMPPKDAGAPPKDAGTPDAGACTTKQCCSEAKRWMDDKDDEDDQQRKCGCDNLLQAITCGLLQASLRPQLDGEVGLSWLRALPWPINTPP